MAPEAQPPPPSPRPGPDMTKVRMRPPHRHVMESILASAHSASMTSAIELVTADPMSDDDDDDDNDDGDDELRLVG